MLSWPSSVTGVVFVFDVADLKSASSGLRFSTPFGRRLT